MKSIKIDMISIIVPGIDSLKRSVNIIMTTKQEVYYCIGSVVFSGGFATFEELVTVA